MHKRQGSYVFGQRLLAFVLAFVMVLGYFPGLALTGHADSIAPVTTVHDPYVEVNSLDNLIYGSNTKNAGKVTVDKNVIDDSGTITLPGVGTMKPSTDNFLVQVSQSAQVMALSREIPVPIDAVFVLDTSGSMTSNGSTRADKLMTATNNAIKALMEANDDNRVGVVAFSGVNQGEGTSQGAAANMLSELAHYDDDAADNHLYRVNSRGVESETGSYIAGRTTVTIDNRGNDNDYSGPAFRRRGNGGTNIQAGISMGGEMLASVPENDTTVTYGSGATTRTVTRMPVLIVVSDGNPTYIVSDTDWYDASPESQSGNGSYSYEGNAFMTMLTAAYWKGKITENYYGEEADSEQRCSIYTVGLDLDNLGNDDEALAELTLNPRDYAADSYQEGNYTVNNTFWEYGNSWNDNRPNTTYAPETYWDKYLAGNQFNVRYASGNNDTANYSVTQKSITDTKDYVNYHNNNGIVFNDDYFAATSSGSDLDDKFSEMIMKIQLKAMSMPTRIEEAGENFSGYVTFIDTIGEFMEVKAMKGIYTDGSFYDGTEAAKLLARGDSAVADVIDTRLDLIGSSVSADDLMAKAQGNSIVWWGHAYSSDGLMEKIQCLGVAENDSVEYIKAAKELDKTNPDTIPEGADVVSRSYFFTANGTNNEYLHYVVRVMRSLNAPYQQTVTVSAPASLLSVDKVLVNEKLSSKGTTYTVMLEDQAPARVIYEVGLRSDMNAANVAAVVAEEMPGYATEQDAAKISENYTESTKTYHFFTNDWDRTKDGGNHHRAMSQAIFEAAEDNDFYIYQENTYLVDADGNRLTSAGVGTSAYIERPVYTWNTNTQINSDGTYNATRSVEKIPVTIRDASVLVQDTNGVYIKAGTHAESTLAANGLEDTNKSANTTNTAYVVRHPHYGGYGTSHYIVLLGNNGKLSLKYEAPKTVKVQKDNGAGTLTNVDTDADDDGQPVMVGQYLEYKIKVSNNDSKVVLANVTDSVPAGTVLVANSAKVGEHLVSAYRNGYEETPFSFTSTGNKLEWKNVAVPANSSITVSFKVQVTEDAVSTTQQIGDIQNTATIKLGNNPSYTTNTVENPPEGKTVTDGGNNDLTKPEDSAYPQLKVGDELTYHIQWANDTSDKATVTITDVAPDGLTVLSFVGNATSQGLTPVVDANKVMVWTKENDYILTYTPATDTSNATLKWELLNRDPGATGYVSFKAVVNADAVTENKITNSATIQIGTNDPGQKTNPVTVQRKTGNLSVKKTVRVGDGIGVSQNSVTGTAFTFKLEDPTGTLNGKFALNGVADGITFTNGQAEITGVNHDEVLVISGLPLGVTINITEENTGDWVMNCTQCTGGTATTDASSATVAAEGSSVIVTESTGAATGDVTITNCYHPTPVQFQLNGTKHYLGQITDNTNFTFTATEVNATGSPLDANGDTATATVIYNKGDDSDSFVMMSRNFYEQTTKYYLIKEEAIAGTSMIMDSSVYMLRLDITKDDVTKRLTASAKIADSEPTGGWGTVDWSQINTMTWETDTGTISFTNIAPTPAQVPLTVKKILQNRHLTDSDTFTFSLYKGAYGAGGELIETAQNGTAVTDDPNARTYTFNPLQITWADMDGAKEKTFAYHIYENNTGIPDVTYDTSIYEVAVTVKLNESTGNLEPSVVYTQKNADGTASKESITFTNTFVDGATVRLTGQKIVNKPADVTVGNFEFGIFAQEGEANGEPTYSETAIAGSTYDAKTGKITFGDLDYTLDDFAGVTADNNGVKTITRNYLIREIIPGASAPTFDPFMDYDETAYEITVTVTLSTVTGQMEATVSGNPANNFTFTNTKHPSTVSVTPAAKKIIKGSNVPANLSFSFDVYSATLSDTGSTVIKGTVLEGTGTSEATEAPVTSSADEAAATEQNNGNATGDDTTPAGDGETPDDDTTGQENDSTNESGSPDVNLLADETPKNVTFTSLVFGLEDANKTHYFLIEEVPVPGIQCSTAKFLMEVPIDHVNGELKVREGYPKYYHVDPDTMAKGAEVQDDVTFINTYTATSLPLNLTAHKTLSGGRDLAANEFDFVLKRGNSIVATAKNDADGTVSFASLVYTNEMLDDADDENGNLYYFNYTMEEVEPAVKIPGVKYDKTTHEVVVQVEQTTSELKASLFSVGGKQVAANTTDTNVTFANIYKPETADSVTITGNKTLMTGGHGRHLEAGEFNFELYRVIDNEETLIAVATNDANGHFSFTRPYTVEGLAGLMGNAAQTTIHYRIREVETGLRNAVTPVNPGYTVDVAVVVKHDKANAKYTVEPPVYSAPEVDNNGKIVEGGGTEAGLNTFYNKYEPKATQTTLKGTKILRTADSAIKQNQFSFQVMELKKIIGGNLEVNTTEKQVASGGTAEDKELDANKTSEADIVFTNITFTHAGEYFYEVREVNSGEAGYTYDTAKHYVKIVVEENEGALTVDSTTYYTDDTFQTPAQGKNQVTFENHYGPGEIDVELQLKKQVIIKDADNHILTDKNYSIQESEFDVTAVSKTVSGVVIYGTTAAGENTAVINLGTRTFTHDMVVKEENWVEAHNRYEQIFEYTVTEDVPANTGALTYDGETITVNVLVYDDGFGNMGYETPTFSKTNGTGAAITGDGADTFVNVYAYRASTPLTILAKKVLNNKSLKAAEFSFELKRGDEVLQTKKNDADGLVTFDEISFSAPGEYTYTISEERGANTTNYTYDEKVYTVVVNVVSDVAGNLIATPIYYLGTAEEANVVAAPVVFTNSYEPSPIQVELSAQIGATKEITGAENMPLEDFTFKVTDSAGNPVMGIASNGTETPIIGVSDEHGDIKFNASFRFSASGVYHYYISETGSYPGYTMDNSVWSVYIPVSYNAGPDVVENVLDQSGDGKAEPGELYIQKDSIFSQKQASVIQPQDAEAQPQAEGKPVFINRYNPEPTSVTIVAEKKLLNAETNTARELKGGEFRFYLKDKDVIAAESHNDANGKVTFTIQYTAKDMSNPGSDGKTFTYEIVEDTTNPHSAITYDTTGISGTTVTVKLKTGNDGKLSATVTEGNGKVFTNTYSATPATAQITATKSLAGLKLANIRFRFNLVEGLVRTNSDGTVSVVNEAGEPIDLSKATVVKYTDSDETGKIVFEPLSYDLDDLKGAQSKTFHYVLYEVAGDTKGMTYDTTLHPVTVTVTDDQKGTLSAVVAYGQDGQSAAPIIYNSYRGDSQFVSLEAVKALSAPNSKTMNLANQTLNGKFTFQLLTKDADGKETILETVTNQAKLDAQGNLVDYSVVRFSTIEYQDVGTHTYYIREVKGDMAGMTYDTAEHKVVVTVTQDLEDGQYDIAVDYSDGAANAEQTTEDNITYTGKPPVITNTYKVEPVKISLEADKVMRGRSLRKGEFTFHVHDSNGTKVAEARNDKAGNILFENIKLSEAGTYKLTVSEVRGHALFVSYDRHTYTVKVEVSEVDGVLKVDKISYPGDGITFKNSYNPGGPANTGDQTPLVLLISIMAVSAAGVVIMLVLWKKRKNR